MFLIIYFSFDAVNTIFHNFSLVNQIYAKFLILHLNAKQNTSNKFWNLSYKFNAIVFANHVTHHGFSIFLSFRQAIADFLNYYMKPVEPIIPEEVRVVFVLQRLISTLKIALQAW